MTWSWSRVLAFKLRWTVRSGKEMVDETRQRILHAYLLAALLLGPAYAGFFAIFGAWRSFGAPAVFTAVSLLSALLAHRRRCRTAVTLLLAGLWFGPVWATLTTGGLRSPILIWLTPTPFMAGALLGRRAAIAVGSGSVLVVVGLALVAPGGIAAEMSAPPEMRLLSTMAAASAVALLTFYGFATTKNFEEAQARVEAQARDMQAVLDNVDQGLCLIGRDGRVLAGHSAALTRWFGRPPEDMRIWDFAHAHHPRTAAALALAWGELEEGVMPGWVILEQCPSRVEIDGRTYAMAFRPVGDPDAPSAVLLVMSDVTAALAAERTARETQELLALFEQHTTDPRACRRTIDELDALVSVAVCAPPAVGEGRDAWCRAVHTLKGNAGACGLGTLAEQAHDLEDQVAEGSDDRPSRARLRATWAGVHARLASWSGPTDHVGVDRAELTALAAEVRRRAPELASALEQLAWDRVDGRLQEMGTRAAALAERIGKPRPRVEVRAVGVRTPEGIHQPFFSGLVHVLRNAVDHGIESPDVRVAVGKPPTGVLTLAAAVHADTLHVDVGDDGRGIDWGKVAARAHRQGLPAGSHDDLVAAIFSDGVSTADAVTEVSGRGVGLAAVRATVLESGGRLAVESDRTGTRFHFELPLASTAPVRRAG